MTEGTNRAESEIVFKERVHTWAAKIRVKPKQVRLQAMKRKWASCSTEGRVTFSLDLLEEASSFQDYVIVHELIHLKVPNHGKLFTSMLSAHLPGYKHMAKPEPKSSSTLTVRAYQGFRPRRAKERDGRRACGPVFE